MMEIYTISIWDHLVFFLLGIALPVYTIWKGKLDLSDMEFDTSTKLQVYYGNSLILWGGALIVIFIWWIQAKSFASLGFSPPIISTIVIILSSVIVLLYIIDAYRETFIPTRRIQTIKRFKENTPFLPANKNEFFHFCFLAVTAGITEEIIYRGFIVNYLLFVFGNSISGIGLAVLIPAIAFGGLHIYQGKVAVFKIILLAIIFGLIFVFSKSLYIVIVIHVLIDLVGGVLAVGLMREE